MPALDAIIAGGGPGGMLTALLAHGQGLRTAVVESRAATPTRWNVVYLNERSLGLLDKVGLRDRVLDGLHQPKPGRTMVPLDRLDSVLRRAAAERGVRVHYESTIDGVHQLGRDGVRVDLHGRDGAARSMQGALLVDATGGRLGIEEGLGMGRVQRTGLQRAMTVEWPHDPRRANQVDAQGRDGYLLGQNDAEHGLRGTIIADSAKIDLPRLVAQVARKLGQRDAPTSARVIALGTSMAEHARAGRIVGIGDTVSTVHPMSAEGVNAALADAKWASRLIGDVARHPEGARWHLQRFEAGVLRVHERAVRRSLEATHDYLPELPADQQVVNPYSGPMTRDLGPDELQQLRPRGRAQRLRDALAAGI